MIKKLFRLFVLALLLVAGWVIYFVATPLQLPSMPYDFTLKHGSSLRGVSRQLVDANVLKEPWTFTVLVRVLGKAGELKAGNYYLEKNPTPFQLFRMITRGDVSQSEIALIEGWNFRRMRQALDEHQAIRHDSAQMSEQEILEKIGAQEKLAEGLFFPDTYYFSSGMSDLDILRRAYQAMQKRLESAWAERDPLLPYLTPYEALIMASIVEKETGQASERPMIAGVFVNRLRLNMRLQTDPTVIYGLGGGFDGNLRRTDLLADTPYNTYTRSGLPPGPISMPGWGALQAAVHPAATKALYFVGKGNGTHKFSSSLEEHNLAVARYQLNRK
ncbi:MAG: endolytic transglycosylase MltG [Nitrosomonadales bacterium]|nr:MAG: endolytic transglycosylase MltG [Nitrosomonadales bacterium]